METEGVFLSWSGGWCNDKRHGSHPGPSGRLAMMLLSKFENPSKTLSDLLAARKKRIR
jgi:hypothetical protein